MKKKSARKIAVRVAAVFSVAVLSVCWFFLAFITSEKISTDDFSAYTVTQILADGVPATKEKFNEAVESDRFSGAVANVFTTKDGVPICTGTREAPDKKTVGMTAEEAVATGKYCLYETYLDIMTRCRKTAAVRLVGTFSDENIEDLWLRSVSSIPRKRLIFLSESRENVEKLYKTDSLLCVVWETTDCARAFCGLQMGYNVCYQKEDLTEKRVQRAHDAGHLVFAEGASEDAYATVIAMRADFILAKQDE